jgi:general secretion pathway protein G
MRSVFANILSFIRQRHSRTSLAMTLVELLIVVAMVGTLLAIGVPAYNNYIDKVKNHQAIEDIRFIAAALKIYRTENGTFPETLDQVPPTQILGPWDHPYVYFKIEGKTKAEKQSKCRHLGTMIPMNNDFDLCSMGKDGKYNRNITTKQARDDIIRLNDGAYVGLVSEY